MKRRILSIFIAAVMALGLAACGNGGGGPSQETGGDSPKTSDTGAKGASGEPIVVGFSQVGAESDWRTANTESMKSTFTTKNGYELIFDDAQQKQENQITAIRNFIQQEVDYIVLAPVTETGWDTVLQEAKNAGIPVIIVDRMVKVSDKSLYTAWVGSDFELEGIKACEWLNAYCTAKGVKPADVHIADMQGTIGASAQIGRTNGLNAAVKKYGWDLVAQETGEFTQAKGQEVMESWLKQYANINVVYCENDNEAFGAYDAITAAGKTVGPDIAHGQIMLMSFDSTRAGLNDVLDKKIALNTECNPLHGPRVEKIIQQLEAGQTPEKTAYVDEQMFAFDNTVTKVSAKGKEYPTTVVTKAIIDKRAY